MSFKTDASGLRGIPGKQLFQRPQGSWGLPCAPPAPSISWGNMSTTQLWSVAGSSACSFSWELFTHLGLPKIGMFYHTVPRYCSFCIIFFLQFQFLELESFLPSVWGVPLAPCFPFSFGSPCRPGHQAAHLPAFPARRCSPAESFCFIWVLDTVLELSPLLLSGFEPALPLTSDLEDFITAIVFLLRHGGIIKILFCIILS